MVSLVNVIMGPHQEWLQLTCYYLCNSVCHCCRARVPNYVTAPARFDFRHTTESFLQECAKQGDLRRPLVLLYVYVINVWFRCGLDFGCLGYCIR